MIIAATMDRKYAPMNPDLAEYVDALAAESVRTMQDRFGEKRARAILDRAVALKKTSGQEACLDYLLVECRLRAAIGLPPAPNESACWQM